MTRIKHHADYAQKRREEYPDIEEQLDAIWKAVAALAGPGRALPAEAEQMLERIQAVKVRYPKPPIV